MVVLLHFLTGTEGRIISPRPDLWPKTQKWVPTFQSQSIELYAETCTHTNAHTNTVYTRAVWLECCSAPNRNVIAEEASQSRETEESSRRRTAPFGGRLSYCVSFMQQGKVQESVAPPKSSLFLALSLHRPRMPTYY
jgi:hypothetical protein